MNAVKLAIDADVALLTIEVPGSATNTLTSAAQAELATVIEQVIANRAIKGAILTSTKPKAFIGGIDVQQLAARCDRGVSAAQARDLSRDLQLLVRRIETSGKPFVAVINGAALDAGFEIALGCHYRVLADDAVVGLTQSQLGLMPSAGGTQRLPRLIGIARALPLILNGKTFQASETLQLGVVDAVAPSEQLIDKARDWLRAQPEPVQPWDRKGFTVPGGAGPLASGAAQAFMLGTAQIRKQTQGHLLAPRVILSSVYEGTASSFDAGLAIESKYFGKLLADPVTRNLLRTFVVNKERAHRRHHGPEHASAAPVRKLGVLGAGMMGSGIAYVAADAGIDVVLLDTTLESAQRGKGYAQKVLGKAVERGAVTTARAEAVLENIQPTIDYATLDGCDLVIEAVFENRSIKCEVLQRAAAVVGPNAVLASNTSTLPITGLAAASQRPAQFIGLHFFSPVERMPLLEIIRGRDTSEATLAKALELANQLRKTPIVVNDAPGFYTTRVFSTFIDEGLCMLAEGIEPALIENAARLAGMPVGPLAQFDEVSLELSWSIVQQARADGLPERYARTAAAPFIEKMMQLGRRGRRQGGGFYEYPVDDGKKFLWPELRVHFPPKPAQPRVHELELRFLTIQALEAVRCVEEGVITDAADADLGGVLGIGFPQWTGGPLSYVDTIGVRTFVTNCERFAAAHGVRYAPSPWLKARAAAGETFHRCDAIA